MDSAATIAGLIFGSVILPTTISQLAIFYLFWILGFAGVNILWDINSDKTPKFHIHRLTEKVSVLHNAAAFSSSLLIIIGVVSPAVGKIAQDTMVPLILAAAGGMLLSLPAICPYPPKAASAA